VPGWLRDKQSFGFSVGDFQISLTRTLLSRNLPRRVLRELRERREGKARSSAAVRPVFPVLNKIKVLKSEAFLSLELVASQVFLTVAGLEGSEVVIEFLLEV